MTASQPRHAEVNNNLNDSKFDDKADDVIVNNVVAANDVVFRSETATSDEDVDDDVTTCELNASVKIEVREKVQKFTPGFS